jgi:hypothetical protein
MAYELAVRNGIANPPFSKDSEQIGKKWMRNFLKRNSQLAVPTRDGFSFARAKGFTPKAVSRFFYISETVMDKIHHSPSRLYKCDETGITVVPHKHTKVVDLKGKRQIAALQAAERRTLITIVTCMILSGHFVPPSVIFPRNKYETGTNAWHTSWFHLCLPPVWLGADGYVHRVASSLHPQCQTYSRRPCVSCVTWPLFIHKKY